jgi:hypothetical protein
MSSPFAVAEEFLNKGELPQAADALRQLRPGLQPSFEALQLWTRVHFATRAWDKVSALSRLMRKDYPQETYGFSQGAESLHQQGRTAEAIDLLKECTAGLANDPTILYALGRYYCAVDNLLGAALLLGTAFDRDVRLRDKAFADSDLTKVWPSLQESWEAPVVEESKAV